MTERQNQNNEKQEIESPSPNEFRLLRTLIGHDDVVSCVAVSPDGKYIVSGSCDKTIKIWGVE